MRSPLDPDDDNLTDEQWEHNDAWTTIQQHEALLADADDPLAAEMAYELAAIQDGAPVSVEAILAAGADVSTDHEDDEEYL